MDVHVHIFLCFFSASKFINLLETFQEGDKINATSSYNDHVNVAYE